MLLNLVGCVRIFPKCENDYKIKQIIKKGWVKKVSTQGEKERKLLFRGDGKQYREIIIKLVFQIRLHNKNSQLDIVKLPNWLNWKIN